MPVPSSTITIRDIFNEINGTSHGANAQIGSGVTMSSLRTSSIAYNNTGNVQAAPDVISCLLYTSPSPRDRGRSRMPSSA